MSDRYLRTDTGAMLSPEGDETKITPFPQSREGKAVQRGSFSDKKGSRAIGVFTSGGDSQGKLKDCFLSVIFKSVCEQTLSLDYLTRYIKYCICY